MTAAPEGRKLLRLEIRNAETPIERKPEWIKTKAKMGPEYTALHSLVKSEDLHTVCQEAGCPNIFAVHPTVRLLPDRHGQARCL